MEKILSSGWDEVSYMWWDRYENRIEYFPHPMPEAWKKDMRGCQIESSRLRAINEFSKKIDCVCRDNLLNYMDFDACHAECRLFWLDKLNRPLHDYLVRIVSDKLKTFYAC